MEYELVGSVLVYRTIQGGVPTSHSLVAATDSVQLSSFSIVDEDGQDWQGLDCVKALVISVVFQVDGKQYPFTATARPRRNIVY